MSLIFKYNPYESQALLDDGLGFSVTKMSQALSNVCCLSPSKTTWIHLGTINFLFAYCHLIYDLHNWNGLFDISFLCTKSLIVLQKFIAKFSAYKFKVVSNPLVKRYRNSPNSCNVAVAVKQTVSFGILCGTFAFIRYYGKGFKILKSTFLRGDSGHRQSSTEAFTSY